MRGNVFLVVFGPRLYLPFTVSNLINLGQYHAGLLRVNGSV